MASNAYKNHGVIIIWWDESEADGTLGDNPNHLNHTIGELVISQRAHPNVDGLPYASPVNYTHSSDLRTMQDIFRVGPFLDDAINANDLSDLFKAGGPPEEALGYRPGSASAGPRDRQFFTISAHPLRDAFCLRTRFVRISAASQIHSSNCDSQRKPAPNAGAFIKEVPLL